MSANQRLIDPACRSFSTQSYVRPSSTNGDGDAGDPDGVVAAVVAVVDDDPIICDGTQNVTEAVPSSMVNVRGTDDSASLRSGSSP